MQEGFADYKLSVYGLVREPREFSLDDLKHMRCKSQITKHVCVQGWTGIAQWAGISVADLLDACGIEPEGKRIYFHSFQMDPMGRCYYTSLDIEECRKAATILAYEMNRAPLTIEHGAPLRLRVETKLGFTMCKWVKAIQVVSSIAEVGEGHGGYREDYQYYGTEAEI
jgi:DMSO/TMAO reductase YedYZ molybdopterin-dependent catalytic subunit